MMRKTYPLTVFGRFIRDRIAAKAITQAGLAVELGVSEANLSTILHGRRPMPADRATQLAEVLGIPQGEIGARVALTRLGDEDARLVLTHAAALAPSYLESGANAES